MSSKTSPRRAPRKRKVQRSWQEKRYGFTRRYMWVDARVDVVRSRDKANRVVSIVVTITRRDKTVAITAAFDGHRIPDALDYANTLAQAQTKTRGTNLLAVVV